MRRSTASSALAWAFGLIWVLIVRPPRLSVFMRSAAVLPRAGKASLVSTRVTYRHSVGKVELTQPFMGCWTSFGSKGVMRTAAASASVMRPSCTMRESTMLRRFIALVGWFTGSVATGFCTRPASSVACARVSFSAVVLK